MNLMKSLAFLGLVVGSLAQTEVFNETANCSIHEEVAGYYYNNISDLGIAVLMNSTKDIDHALDNGCDVNYNGTILGFEMGGNNDDENDDYEYNDDESYDYGSDDYGSEDYEEYDNGGYDYDGYDYGGYDYGYDDNGDYIYVEVDDGGNDNHSSTPVTSITALHIAVLEGNKAMVTKLCAVPGIDLDMVHSYGNTALSQALESNKTEIMEELLLAGANVNQTYQTSTLLHRAVTHLNIPAVELLIKHGVAIDAQHSVYGTAIIFGVIVDSPAIVELLLAAGADTTIKDSTGFSAEQYADAYAEFYGIQVYKDMFDSRSD